MNTRTLHIIPIIAIILGALTSWSYAQEQVKQTREVEEEIRVILRLIDITAKDSQGNFVTDLRKDEFILEVDGKRLPIDTLDSYYPEPPVVTEDEEIEVVEVPGTPARYLILFFDRSYSSARGIRQAKDAARKFIENNLRINDYVMVAGFDRGLKIYQDFTRNSGLLLAAVEQVKQGFHGFSFHGRKEIAAQFLQNQLNAPESIKDTQKLEAEYDARLYLNSLSLLARYLKTFRGRKTLVLLSQGSPQLTQILPTTDVMRAATENDQSGSTATDPGEDTREIGAYDPRKVKYSVPEFEKELTEKLYSTAREFNNSNVIVYPIDLAGIRFGNNSSFEEGDYSSLKFFADETGGEFFLNSNDISRQLERANREISHYYVLGFSSEEAINGEQHNIRISTTRPGVSIRHGKAFVSPKKFETFSFYERIAHLEEGFSGVAPRSDLAAAAALHFFTLDDGTSLAKVTMDIPITGGGSGSEFEILGYLIGANGTMDDAFHKILTFDPLPADSPVEKVVHSETVEARRGSNTMKLAIRDNSTGERFYWFSNFTVSEGESQEIADVSSIVIMKQNPDKFIPSVEAARVDSYEQRMELPASRSINPLSLLESKGIMASTSNEVSRDVVLTVAMRIIGYGSLEEDSQLASDYVLQDQDGNQYRMSIVEQGFTTIPGSRSKLLVTRFDAHTIPPGEYILIAKIFDTGAKVFTEQKTETVFF
jgi:VWFA-related protein